MSTIIECRNEPALQLQPLAKKGDWVTNLQRHVPIYEGDTIIARNCFIDTKASNSQKVVVDEDLNLAVEFFIYNVNWEGAVNTGSGFGGGGTTEADPVNSSIIPEYGEPGLVFAKNDGELYINCTKKDHTGREMSYVGAWPILTMQPDPLAGATGNFTVFFLYVNEQGQTNGTYADVPRYGAVALHQKLSPPGALLKAEITFDRTSVPVYPTDAGAPLAGNPISTGAVGIFLAPEGFGGPVQWNQNLAVSDPYDNKGVGYRNIAFPTFDSKTLPVPRSDFLSNEAYYPVQYRKEVTITGGPEVAYDPTELAKEINRQFTKIDTTNISSDDLTGNNLFLQSFGKDATPENQAQNNYWIEITNDGTSKYPLHDGIYGYHYNNNVNAANDVAARWGGASQVELDYNPTTKRFGFSYLHFPFYDAGSIGVGLKTATPTAVTSDRIYPITKNGGIILRNLTARKASNGELVPNWWQQTLGFGTQVPIGPDGALDYTLAPLVPEYTQADKKSDGTEIKINGQSAVVPIFPNGVFEGVNLTGGFQGLDTVVQKGDSKDPQSSDVFYRPPTFPLPNGNTFIFSTSDDTVECEATRSLFNGQNQLNSGYFLVEVKAEFQNQFLTPDTNRGNVAAIVSRYYQLDSYTSAEAGSSVIYKHSGAPQLLNSFNCRILDPNGNLATGIGSDNSIFLEIIRAPKPMMPLTLPPPDEKEKEKKEA